LLFNAVKHAQVNEARVRVRQCGGYLCLSVSDRGRMKIRSAPGKGSTFSIIVPDAEKAEDRGQKTEDSGQRTEG